MIRDLIAKITAGRELQRTREVNAQCRVDEVRAVLRHGTADDRSRYIAASAAWREAGEPDVPFITRWHAEAGYVFWDGHTDDAADSTAWSVDGSVDDPGSEFALVDNDWLGYLAEAGE